MRKSIILSVLALALVFSFVAVAYAPSNYSVTSNYHGIDVPAGASVVVTASTTDATVYQVTFLWKNPGGNTVWTDVVPINPDGTATSTHAPDEIGDWGVQALFQSPDGTTKQGVEEVIAIRATSFNVVPEVPLIGTAGASIAMLAGLTYKMKRKPQK